MEKEKKREKPSASDIPSFAIGNDDFAAIAEEKASIIDKSLFVKAMLDDETPVKVIIRPRRFGKTFDISLLASYFDSIDLEKTRSLFESMKIWSIDNGKYQRYHKQYPVIFLTFKDINASDFDGALKQFQDYMLDAYLSIFKRHHIETDPQVNEFNSPLAAIIEWLHEQCGKQVVLLIDEYDMPIYTAYTHTPKDRLAAPDSYYQRMINLMRSMFSSVLQKNNRYLYRTLLTGVLPVITDILQRSEESLFIEPDFIKVYSVIDHPLSEYFGFSAQEVRTQLKQAFGELANDALFNQVRDHYGGYCIGKKKFFNPWSITNFIEDNRQYAQEELIFKDYWIVTSGNELVEHMLQQSDESTKQEFEMLLLNKPIIKCVSKHMVLTDINKNSETLWGFLLLSGYLTTSDDKATRPLRPLEHRLIIPNLELHNFYSRVVKKWAKAKPSTEVAPILKSHKDSHHVADYDERKFHMENQYHTVSVDRESLPHEPKHTGWRLSLQEEQISWQRSLRALFAQDPQSSLPESAKIEIANGKVVWVEWIEQHQSLWAPLKPKYAEAMLDQNKQRWQPKTRARDRHKIYHWNTREQRFSVKIYPEQPGTEYLVMNVDRRLSNHGTAQQQLMAVHHAPLRVRNGTRKGMTIQQSAILVSEHITEEQNLHTILKHQPELLEKLDFLSFAKTLLRVLLISPQDDNGNDYFLVPLTDSDRYQLIRINNEHIFLPITTIDSQKNKKKLPTKNILYCFDQMLITWDKDERIEGLLNDLRQIQPSTFVIDILLEITLLHNDWQRLFSFESINQHACLREPWMCFPIPVLPSGLETTLLKRFTLLQEALRTLKPTQITGLQLLKIVQPELVRFYNIKLFQGKLVPDAKQLHYKINARFDRVAINDHNRQKHHHSHFVPEALGPVLFSQQTPIALLKTFAQRIWRKEIYSVAQAFKSLESSCKEDKKTLPESSLIAAHARFIGGSSIAARSSPDAACSSAAPSANVATIQSLIEELRKYDPMQSNHYSIMLKEIAPSSQQLNSTKQVALKCLQQSIEEAIEHQKLMISNVVLR